MTLMQTIQNWFKPKAAAYSGAGTNNFTLDWIMSPVSADKEIRNDAIRLRTRARDLAKNSPIVQQYSTLLTDNVIGPEGIKMQGQIRYANGSLNKKENDNLEMLWGEWSRDCTVTGNMSLIQFQHMAIKTVAIDGECFIRKVYGKEFCHGFALQMIDADLVDHDYNQIAVNGNMISMGIEINSWGRPVAIHVWTGYGDDGIPRNRQRISSDEIIHLFDPQRVRQTRGTTWLNAIMLPVKMLDGFLEAELIAARCASAKMGFFKYTDPSAYQAPDPSKPYTIEATPGEASILPPGLEFQSWDPQHPNSAFADFHKAVKREIACGLKVSYNALANDLEGVNYSSIRAGLLIERDHWRTLQRWWIDRFLFPVLSAWQKSPLINLRKPAQVKWCARGWAWVDPLKDVNASIIAINNGLASRTDIISEKGGDIETIFEQLSQEKQMATDYNITFAEQPAAPEKAQPVDDKEEEEKEAADNEELV